MFGLYVAAPLISILAVLAAIFAMQVGATFPASLFERACSVLLIAAASGLDRCLSPATRRSSESTTRAGGLPAGSSRLETWTRLAT